MGSKKGESAVDGGSPPSSPAALSYAASARLEKAQQTFEATLGSDRRPSTKLVSRDTIHCSLITTSGMISQSLPMVQAAVSLTTTDSSLRRLTKRGIAWAQSGERVSGSGPSKMEPKAMAAASLSFQSVLTMLFCTKGKTCGITSFSQHVAISIKHTPAALQGFQSSSSSISSCLHKMLRMQGMRC